MQGTAEAVFLLYCLSMLGKFFLSFVAILLYMGMLSLVLLVVVTQLDGDIIPWAVGGFALIVIGTFPVAIDRIAKLIFRFKGEGSPISVGDLRSEILAINTFGDLPITVREDGKRIIVSWKYLDAKWWEVLQKKGVRESYELVIKLDAKRHRATLIDITRSLTWGIGPSTVRFGSSFFRGIRLEYKRGKAWGIRENFSIGKIYDFTFRSEDIHDPVMNTILRSGWNVRFGLF